MRYTTAKEKSRQKGGYLLTGIYKNHYPGLSRFLAALLLCAAAAALLSPAALASGGEKTASAQISTGVSGTAEVT